MIDDEIDWTNPLEAPFPLFNEKGNTIDGILHARIESLPLKKKNSAINYLWKNNIDILCYSINYRHRHVIDHKALCFMPEGYRCKFNCDKMICGYDIE